MTSKLPFKRPEMTKLTSFVDFQNTVYRGSRAVEIIPEDKNSALQPMKMARNDKIHEFYQIPNYHVPGVTGVEIIPGAKKQCAVAHENDQK